MRSIALSLFGIGSAALFAFACGSTSDGSAANESAATTDLQTARAVLKLVADPDTGKCVSCHEADVKAWGTTMKAVYDRCLDPAVTLTDVARIDCLRTDPSDATSSFSAAKLGLYSAGLTLPEFQQLFQSAYPDEWQARLKEFQQAAKMPKNNKQLSAADFGTIKTWVLAGMPRLADATHPDVGPTSCTDTVTDRMKAQMKRMRAEGWGAVNADHGISMFGCGTATNATECLTSFPELTDIGDGALPQTIRKLRDLPYTSHYWVRSSADGRYVGVGLFNNKTAGARIMDLQAIASGAGTTDILIDAQYDPSFLPDNDGFSFAGAGASGQIAVCKQSLLADLAADAAPEVKFTESKCLGISKDVYQSIGASLDGKKYFLAYGNHQNDDGGRQKTALSGEFKSDAKLTLTPMVNDGSGSYVAKAQISVPTPYEGDVQLSPSGAIAINRFGAAGKRLGFQLRFLDATATGDTYKVEVPEAAQVCLKGAKATLSFDERVLVTHQYVDPSEADHAGLPAGSSNIVLADLATGTKARITKMGANQFALYPHFRSDGWLYFVVRDMNTGKEYLAATDVALRLPAIP